jgi:adenine C2-methylase RlmN of 23S rRNA A2503 and tRNA A37
MLKFSRVAWAISACRWKEFSNVVILVGMGEPLMNRNDGVEFEKEVA